MKILNAVAATATVVLTLASGQVMAYNQLQVTVTNGFDFDISGHQTAKDGSQASFTISAGKQQAFYVVEENSGADYPYSNSVQVENIPAPDGGSPSNANFDFTMNCTSDNCNYTQSNSGQPDWLMCSGDCNQSVNGTGNKSLSLSYSSTSKK